MDKVITDYKLAFQLLLECLLHTAPPNVQLHKLLYPDHHLYLCNSRHAVKTNEDMSD